MGSPWTSRIADCVLMGTDDVGEAATPAAICVVPRKQPEPSPGPTPPRIADKAIIISDVRPVAGRLFTALGEPARQAGNTAFRRLGNGGASVSGVGRGRALNIRNRRSDGVRVTVWTSPTPMFFLIFL